MATKPHTCVADVDAALASRNTRLSMTISLKPGLELIQVSTVKVDEKKRGRPALMYASYCPFCGVKLSTSEKDGS